MSAPWEHAVTHAHPRFLRAGAGVSCPAAEGQTPVQSGHCSVSEDWPASSTSVETSSGPAGANRQLLVNSHKTLFKKKNYHNWWYTVITNLTSSRPSILQEDAVWKNTSSTSCPKTPDFPCWLNDGTWYGTADCDSSQTLHLQLLSKSPEGTSMTVQAARDLLQTVLQELCLHKHKICLHHYWRCSFWSGTYIWSVDANVRMKRFHIGVLQPLHQGLILHIRSVCQKAD